MKIVDFFCGIGGVAEATRQINAGANDREASVVAAIDIDQNVRAVYEHNHGITPLCKTLESITEIPEGDLWWLSPPCQPYTRRGQRLAENDSRSAALQHLIGLIDRLRPRAVALENVPQFEHSGHHRRLINVLDAAGYAIRCELLCPTQWGVPMRRKRFYLRARRDHRDIADVSIRREPRCLAQFIDESNWDDDALRVSPQRIEQYRTAIDLVVAGDPDAVAACFTSAYGNSPVHCGSYLHCPNRQRVRRFTPSEITGLMGFHNSFHWPGEISTRDRYRMVGNSLSVTVVADLLRNLIAQDA